MSRLRAVLLLSSSVTGCATLFVATDDLGGGGAAVPTDAAVDTTSSTPESPDAAVDGGVDAGPADARSFPAGSVVWPVNGHGYLVVSRAGGYTWREADAAARERGGYLVTVGSAEENTFVFELLGALGPGAWLGARQMPNATEPAGGWSWTNGEPMTYTRWYAGQPNDDGAGEDALHYHIDGDAEWSDEDDRAKWPAFVVEFE